MDEEDEEEEMVMVGWGDSVIFSLYCMYAYKKLSTKVKVESQKSKLETDGEKR